MRGSAFLKETKGSLMSLGRLISSGKESSEKFLMARRRPGLWLQECFLYNPKLSPGGVEDSPLSIVLTS